MQAKTKVVIKKMNRFLVAGVVFGLVLVLLVTFLGIRTIDAGEVAVVTRYGATTGKILEPGFHIITPFIEGTLRYSTKKVIYETTPESKHKGSDADYLDWPVDTNTSDGQPVVISYTVRFNVDPTRVVEMANNLGNMRAAVEKIVTAESRIWARNVTRNYTAEELYTGSGSEKIQNEIFSRLNQTFNENGLILDSVGIREIQFPDRFVSAIETKQLSAVQIETEKNNAAQAEFRKEATITEAEAEAEKQRLQRETLSQTVLDKERLDVQREWIKRWNGSVPSTMLGENSNLLFQMPQ